MKIWAVVVAVVAGITDMVCMRAEVLDTPIACMVSGDLCHNFYLQFIFDFSTSPRS